MNRPAPQRGFSLVELLIVLTILGVLARMSLPVLAGMRRNAIASEVAGDFNAVRAASVAQFEATGSYAADAAPGVVPGGMAPFLPRDFPFTRKDYQLDWENWAVSDTTNGVPSTGFVLALTVVTADEKLGRQVLATLGRNCTHWTVDDASTFVLVSTLESPY